MNSFDKIFSFLANTNT